jgi:DNA-binding Lrp family transcriptional regulator
MRDAPVSSIRVAARLGNGFALDLVKLGGVGGALIDRLLLAAITQANVAQISRSPELQRSYARLDDVPPDELRRPVSINAIAGSLRIPFETARRRIAALVEAGVVQVTAKGVIVPQAPLNSPFYRSVARAHYELVKRLYQRLRAIGLLRNLPEGSGGWDPERPPVRLVIRLSSDYLLRLAEPLTEHIGDLVTGLVMMDIVEANTEHLSDLEGGGEDLSAEGFVADVLRRPVRLSALSARLGIPQETVRRHIARLIKDDRCERVAGGYLAPARVLSRGPFQRYMFDNQANLHRLFAGLAEHGVPALWDTDEQALRGAA